MKQTVKTRSGRVLVLPTPAEDVAIAAGIAQDSETYEPNALELGMMRRPGRPLGSGTKTQITLRLEELGADERMTAVAAYAGYCSL